MTIQDVYKIFEFKVIKAILKQTYPWIIDVIIDKDSIRAHNYIALNIKIDPYKLQQETGWEFTPYTLRKIKENFFDNPIGYLSIYEIYQISYIEGKTFKEKIIKIIKQTHESTIIPKELKVPRPFNNYVLNGFIFQT
jgi:hypothetical protein